MVAPTQHTTLVPVRRIHTTQPQQPVLAVKKEDPQKNSPYLFKTNENSDTNQIRFRPAPAASRLQVVSTLLPTQNTVAASPMVSDRASTSMTIAADTNKAPSSKFAEARTCAAAVGVPAFALSGTYAVATDMFSSLVMQMEFTGVLGATVTVVVTAAYMLLSNKSK